MFELLRNCERALVRTASWMRVSGALFLNICGHVGFASTLEAREESDWMARYFFMHGIVPGDDRRLYFQRDVPLQRAGPAQRSSRTTWQRSSRITCSRSVRIVSTMRAQWIVTWSIALCLALPGARAAPAVSDADRTQVYQEFRALFDAHRYQEALPVAEHLVSMTEAQYGADNRALVNPLTNLGTTHYRLKDYSSAEKDYQRSVTILEATAGNGDRQLLQPLHGLGAAYYAAGQYEDAATSLKRAVDLSRNLDGLFNVEQLAILDPLIASYVALDLTAEAEKEHQYALRVAEDAYGKTNVRMLRPLDSYARWLERVGRYTTARLLHVRALSIAEQVGGRNTTLAVDALQGIARTYRLGFVNGAADTSSSGPQQDPFAGGEVNLETVNGQRLNPDGERALRLALFALEKAQPADHQRRGDALVELGDWYTSGGALGKGVDAYREAWKEFGLAGVTPPLAAPRMLAYRPPPSAATRSHLDAENAEEHFVAMRFTVTREGRTDKLETVGSDASDATQRAVASALKRARYSPRFENGEPADTPGVTFRERILVKAKPPRN